jgi:hypothetical protein
MLLHSGLLEGAPVDAADISIGTPADVLRVDAGGRAEMTTAEGMTFAPDSGFTGGKAARRKFAVAGTQDDPLLARRRVGNFTFAAPVANGT